MSGTYDLAVQVLEIAKTKGKMIATAESCTGGMIAAALTDVAGSSAVFDRGFVSYSYPSKTKMLDVPEAILHEHGAVSEPVALQMAKGALANSEADITVSVTGVAGPGADGDKAEGLVWFAVATKDEVLAREMNFGAIGRDKVRQATVETALMLLLERLA